MIFLGNRLIPRRAALRPVGFYGGRLPAPASELCIGDRDRQRYRHHGHTPAMGSCRKSMVNR